jgi:excisionase family DNA binding protein
MTSTELYMTNQEVADLFRVHPTTVRLWVRQGRLNPIRLGWRTVRFNADEVRQLAADQIAAGIYASPDESDD